MLRSAFHPFGLSFGTMVNRVVSLLTSSIDRIPRGEIGRAFIAPISPFFDLRTKGVALRGNVMPRMSACGAGISIMLCVAGCVSPMEDRSETLAGPVWVVEDIDGRGVIDFLQSTIAFSTEGDVTGSGGCNRFRGRYTRDGSALAIGPLAGTRKACPAAVMNQEANFYEALGRVRGYRFDKGLLYLLDAGGKSVVRLWRQK
jgi:putative lipoprotein